MTRLGWVGIVWTGCAGPSVGTAPEREPPAPTACTAVEVPYDGIDNDCDPGTPDDDLDGDGRPMAEDCDDTDPTLGGPEVPYDGIDNDCDPTSPDDDLDGDGHPLASDCDDANGDVYLPSGTIHDNVVGEDVHNTCRTYCALTIDGNLEVHYDTVRTDLRDLWCVEAVEGTLEIVNNPNLTSLDGLDRLARAGDLVIGLDQSLTSLAALGGLAEVGSVQLTFLPGLVDLTGLGSLTSMDGRFIVGWNDGLRDLSGLENITNIAQSASIYHLESLGDLTALASLEHVGGLELDDLPALGSLAGLEAVRRVDTGLVLDENIALLDATALHGLDEVGGDVVITHNTALGAAEAQALVDAIESIGGTVTLDDNG